MTDRRKPHWPRITRDTVLFVGGLTGIAHETFFRAGAARTDLLVIFAAMVGLPAFLQQGDKRRDNHNNRPPSNG